MFQFISAIYAAILEETESATVEAPESAALEEQQIQTPVRFITIITNDGPEDEYHFGYPRRIYDAA